MNEELLVYSVKDMQVVLDFINSLNVTGIAAARKLSSIATILESGKSLQEYEGEAVKEDGSI